MTRRIVLLASLLVLAVAPAAGAHGGYPVLDAKQGAYAVLVQASGATTPQGESAIDLTTYVTRQDLGEPDLDARVELRLKTPDGDRTLRPQVVGDGYEAIVPGARDAWRHWTVEAVVSGAAGRTVVRADPAADYGGMPGWLIPALVVIVLVGGTVAVRVQRRRMGVSGPSAP